MWSVRVALLGVWLIVLGSFAPAGAASVLEQNFWLSGPRYNAVLPPCNSPNALADIQRHFSEKEWTFWNSPLQLVGFSRIHEVAMRPWAEDTIPRRFCSARALTSDGVHRQVNYSIIEDAGMIGASWGVEWCIVGLDRNWAYNPACRMARP
jgi:hypothetical protein